MKAFFLLLILLFTGLTPARAAEKKRFVLYAVLTQDTVVDLADGARWAMDRGDAFPVLMFKDERRKVVLQLAGTSFLIDAGRLKILTEAEVTSEVLAAYRHNVQTYINTRSDQWKALQTR